MPTKLILASTSRYRKMLLARLGVPFEARAPGVDETSIQAPTPLELARRLAIAKAEAVREPVALVIGSDQVVDLDGEVLGKPFTAPAAVAQLERLAGRSHRLITAVAVHQVESGRTELAIDIHTLTMRRLDRRLCEAYVAHDAPLECAGSYRLESRGIALFDRIEADPETADSSAVVGLPLMKLCGLLRRFGWEPLEG
jgi:septum formation protein